MPVERKGENVTITTESGTMTVAPLKQVKSGVSDEVFQAWLQKCADRMKPNRRSSDGLEAYLRELCDLEPLALEHPQVRFFLDGLILRHFGDRLEHRPPLFSGGMTDEELENWKRETEARRDEVEKLPPERFGLKVHGFHILHTEKNEPFIDADRREWWQKWGNEHCKGQKPSAEPEGYFCYEETTGEGSGSGFGGIALSRKYALFLGVSENDIASRTPRFFGYASALIEVGKLPSLQKFEKGRG